MDILRQDLPVPGLKSIAGPLEQVALHHHTIRSVHIELHLGFVIREVLKEKRKIPKINPGCHRNRPAADSWAGCCSNLLPVKQETKHFSVVKRLHA